MKSLDVGKKIRRLRKAEGLTLKELAEKVQLSESFLSQVERGITSPSITSLKRIGNILGATIASFFESGLEEGKTLFFSRNQTEGLRSELSKARFFLLGPRTRRALMAPYVIEMEPGSTEGSRPYSHQGEEFVMVLEGTVEIKAKGETYLLRKGDAVYFDSSFPHGWSNKSKKTAVVLWICSPSTF